MRRALLIVAAICLPALADDFPRREIFGVVGIGKTYDDEGSLGSGITAAAARAIACPAGSAWKRE